MMECYEYYRMLGFWFFWVCLSYGLGILVGWAIWGRK